MIWDMIERMATDRLWIYTAIVGSIFGALFITWIRKTNIGIWTYNKWASLLDFLVERWGWTWFKPQPSRLDQLETKINKLEKLVDFHIKTK
jgi:hypothetical protein